MALVDACLTPADLARLASGELGGAARTRAERHLEGCGDCREQVQAHRPAWATTRGRPSLRPRARPPEPRATAAVDAAGVDAATGVAPEGGPLEGFEILGEIHRGGQGVVYRARDLSDGRVVALKLLREGPFAAADQRLRFERESALARALDHPGIVAPIRTGVSRGRPFHVMEFIEGRTLDEWLRDDPPLRRRLELFRDTCDAVAHAHERGVVHRDLKPSNIIVDAWGRAHVVDFGVAKSAAGDEALPLTVTGEFVGTLSHASPEQAKGDPRLVDQRTDVHALGLILYELLTGCMPYPVTGAPADVLRHVIETEARHPAFVRPGLDEAICSIALKALAKDPARRYPDARALRDDVAAHLDGLPVQARPDGAWDVLGRVARRNRRGFMVASAFAAVLLGVAVLASVQAARLHSQRDRAEQAEAEARGFAERLRGVTSEARASARVANIAAAGLALQLGRRDEALTRLEAVPEDMRGWEWRHLALAADSGIARASARSGRVLEIRALAGGTARVVQGSGVTIVNSATLATVREIEAPVVPAPDEGARAEILAVSPDGSLFALRWDDASWQRLGATGRTLLLADAGGAVRAVLRGALWRPGHAAFSADGRRIAATTSEAYDAVPRVWSTLTARGEPLPAPAPSGTHAAAGPVAFSPTGSALAWGTPDGAVEVRGAGGVFEFRADAHAAPVTALAWSADGNALASGAADGSLVVLGRDGRVRQRLSTSSVASLALSPDGTMIAAGGADGVVMAWSGDPARSALASRTHSTAVTALAFTPDGQRLLSGAADGSLAGWDRTRADAAPSFALSGATDVSLDARGETIAACSASGAWLAGRVDGAVVVGGGRERAPLAAVAVSPDGARVLTAAGGADTGPVRIWSAHGRDSVSLGPVPAATHAAWSPDGSVVAVLSGIGLVSAWTDSGERLRSAECPEGAATLVLTDQAIVVAWPDGTRRSWALRDAGGAWLTDAEPITQPGSCHEGSTLAGDATHPAPLALGPRGLVASAGEDIVLCADGAVIDRVPLPATALEFMPGGSRLVSADARGGLTILETDPLSPLLVLEAHPGGVTRLAVSADGSTVATVGADGARAFRSRRAAADSR